MNSHTLLIEIGTEELPPKSLRALSDAFTQEITSGLVDAQLLGAADDTQIKPYATPRRLAVCAPNVIESQPDQLIERRGPAVAAAFDDQNKPTPAALGFAKSCGVEVADLQRLKTDKGEWLSYSLEEKGKTLTDLLPGIIDQAIKRLPIAKRMRWGDGIAEFVRPVKWVIVMHGESVLPVSILDVESSNTTRGHRFHSDGDISIESADTYESNLLQNGQVIASFETRRSQILEQVAKEAHAAGGTVEEDPALLDEVTGLVELPYAIAGEFDPEFLDVPQECLISSMRDHQKYFHIIDANGRLLPKFITVSNIQSTNPEQVREGNEKVLRARLSDAQFFWQTDQKIKLEKRVEKLSSVLFHVKLGSVLDKTHRLQQLAQQLASKMGADKEVVKRGALLAKADLVSNMVGEFDELQGLMGHYYATLDGEIEGVGACIEQHYWPKFAGDQLPQSLEAQAVALADRIDSLVGIYAAGEIPTGDKDPYGLRRSALSILRILIEHQHSFNLSELVDASADVYTGQQKFEIDQQTRTDIVNFIRGRLTAFYQAQDIATNTINAVMACQPDSPLDFEHRIKAVHSFTNLPESSDLAAANKRIGNILKKQDDDFAAEVNQALLSEEAEQTLFTTISALEDDCNQLFDAGNYGDGLAKLAALRGPVDNFFEHVMVMSDDVAQKNNRLALLHRMQSLFMRVADIGQLQA